MKVCKIMVLIILILSVICISNKVHANSIAQEMHDDVGEFKKQGNVNVNISDVLKRFVELGKLLTMIGTGTMVAVTAYMGIKYMTSSPETMGKLKIQTVGLLVSGIVIFGAYNIWKITLLIFKDF